MPKDKNRRDDGPIKQASRDGVKIDFNPIGSPFASGLYYYDKENRFHSLYPSVYSIKIHGHGFFPFWDFFTDQYFEDLELLTSEQAWAYTYIASLRNRGIRLSIAGSRSKGDGERRGLAAMLGRGRRALNEDLDHLEDCLLIHRVRRLDLRGTPNDIIVHSPFTPDELHGQGWYNTIKERVAAKTTLKAREKGLISGMGSDGRPFTYMARGAGSRFDYDGRWIIDAFGFNAARFADWALAFFRKNYHYLFSDKPAFDEDYRRDLRLELNLYGIDKNADREKCYIAANAFRRIYCPSYEELLTV